MLIGTAFSSREPTESESPQADADEAGAGLGLGAAAGGRAAAGCVIEFAAGAVEAGGAGAAGEAEKTLHDVDLSVPTALVMGSEDRGLRRLTRDCCDHLVRIPMLGSVSSLNVSVATGVMLFEALRQRSE